MARNRHFGGTPSPHDSTGPRGRGDIQRPLSGSWPKFSGSDKYVDTGEGGGGFGFVGLFGLLAVALSAVLVVVMVTAKPNAPTDPGPQPTDTVTTDAPVTAPPTSDGPKVIEMGWER